MKFEVGDRVRFLPIVGTADIFHNKTGVIVSVSECSYPPYQVDLDDTGYRVNVSPEDAIELYNDTLIKSWFGIEK